MTTLSRRQLIESAALSLAAASAPTLSAHAASSTGKSKPIVYWTPEISSASLQRMFEAPPFETGGFTLTYKKLFRRE